MSIRSNTIPNERWDRDRFERHSRGGGLGPEERDYLNYERRDQINPGYGRPRQDVLVDDKIMERRGPYGNRVEERYFEQDRFVPPARRRTDFLVEPIPPELSGLALAPYTRRKPTWDSDIGPPIPIATRPAPPVRPTRPGMLRRQSSLDTFDRQPRHYDEYHIPPEALETVTTRTRKSRGHEDIVPIDGRRDSERGDGEFVRDIRIRETRRAGGRGRSRSRSRSRNRTRSRSVRSRKSKRGSSSSSDSTFEHVHVKENIKEEVFKEEVVETNLVGRKGRTKLPKRLAHKGAVEALEYPFEEEEDFIIVRRALDKEHIDKIIEISKRHREDKHITYTYEGKSEGGPPLLAAPSESVPEPIPGHAPPTIVEVVAPSKAASVIVAPSIIAVPADAKEVEVIKKEVKEEIKEVDGHGDVKVKEEVRTYKTTVVEPPGHHHHHQDLAVVVPHRHRHSDAAIQREIQALEAERKAAERHRRRSRSRHHHHDHVRDGEVWIERTDRGHRDVVRVDKDRKVVTNPKAVALAMAALS